MEVRPCFLESGAFPQASRDNGVAARSCPSGIRPLPDRRAYGLAMVAAHNRVEDSLHRQLVYRSDSPRRMCGQLRQQPSSGQFVRDKLPEREIDHVQHGSASRASQKPRKETVTPQPRGIYEIRCLQSRTTYVS